MKPLFAAALALALLALAAACDTGARSEVTPTLTTPDATETPIPTIAEPSPIASPLAIAGITLYPSQMWFDAGRSLCASQSLEAPFFGPEVFSVREEDLPKLDLPAEPQDVRICSDGISAIGYIGDGYLVVLADGPLEWPVGASRERISAGTVAGRPAVLVAPTQPGPYGGAMVIVTEDFGLTVVSRTSSLEQALEIAESLRLDHISLPEAKAGFTGPLSGIRFYNNLHGNNRKEGCAWGAYGVEDPRADGTVIPPGTQLDVLPSYLPAGYSLEEKHGTSCGAAIDLVDANFRRGEVSLVVWRLSGEPAWYSVYSEDWLTAGTVDGRPAVFIAPPAWASQADVSVQVVVREEFGLTVVTGQVPLEEATRVAEGLNR